MFPWLRPLHIFAECRCVLLHLDLGQCAIFYRKTMHNARRLALCPCVSSATTAAAAAKNRRWLDGIENQWQEQHNWAFSNLYTNLQSIINKLKSKQATRMHMHNVHTHTQLPNRTLFCFVSRRRRHSRCQAIVRFGRVGKFILLLPKTQFVASSV